MNRSYKLLPVALLAACALAGCAGGGASEKTAQPDSKAAAVSGEITLYTSEPQEKIDEIVATFEQENPNARVNVFRAATGELKTRIAGEKETGTIGADVLLAADVPTFNQYAQAGDLAKIQLKNSKELAAGMVDTEGYWVATRVIPTVIAVNTQLVQKAPTTWADLTQSKYAQKIAMPNPDVSGAAAFNTAAWYLHEDLGEKWLTKLVANKPTVLESNGPVAQAVAAGTSEVGIMVDYLARELAAQGSPIKAVYPTEGVPYITQPAGVFKSSKNQKLATAFVDFLISKQGQEIAVKQSYLPVREDAGSPAGAPKMTDIVLFAQDLEKIAMKQPDAVSFFNSLLR